MKWLFYVLLLANAGFAAWQLQYAAPPEAPDRTAETAIPGHVNRLLLLSEVDEGQLRERTVALAADEPQAGTRGADEPQAGTRDADQPAPPAEPPVPRPVCYTVGPLEDERRMAAIQGFLRAHGGETEPRVNQRREVSLYWVYLPPFPTLEEAHAKRRGMREQGIDDIYVIPRGDMAGAVSLGAYSQRSSLERRLAELKRKGYTPSMTPRYETAQASWVDVRFPPEETFPTERFGERFPDADVARAVCPDAAVADVT